MRLSPLVISVVSTLSSSRLGTSGRSLGCASAFAAQRYIGKQDSPRRTFARNMATNDNDAIKEMVDSEYPGTAVERMQNVRARVKELANTGELDQKWEDVRRKILWAGGLKDLPDAVPGQGYTGHSFNDYIHADLTCMKPVDNTNKGEVKGIAMGNKLGDGIRIASLPELGPGGSWSTCTTGCNQDPPQDVAHVQFQSRIAFKLVWCPNKNFDTFVLVDDDGKLLAKGKPSDGPDGLPPLRERQMNYKVVAESKYSKEADSIAAAEQEGKHLA